MPMQVQTGSSMTLDVFGINYHLDDYKRFFELKDNENLADSISSESASTVSSRGEYFFPVVQGDLNNNLPRKRNLPDNIIRCGIPGMGSYTRSAMDTT